MKLWAMIIKTRLSNASARAPAMSASRTIGSVIDACTSVTI